MGSKGPERRAFQGTSCFINREQGIKQKKEQIKRSWEHVPPWEGSDNTLQFHRIASKKSRIILFLLFFVVGSDWPINLSPNFPANEKQTESITAYPRTVQNNDCISIQFLGLRKTIFSDYFQDDRFVIVFFFGPAIQSEIKRDVCSLTRGKAV